MQPSVLTLPRLYGVRYKRMKIKSTMTVVAMLLMSISNALLANEDGHAWMNSAPAFCRSIAYGQLTPEQRSACDESAFRYLSKNWKTVTTSNGAEYQIALDTIVRPLKADEDGGATLRAASVVVYVVEGSTFNPRNVYHFYFDCHGEFQTFSSHWSQPQFAPRLSVAAQISSIACATPVLRSEKKGEQSARCVARDSVVVNFDPATGISDFRVDKNDCLHPPYQYIGKNRVVSIQGNRIGIGSATLLSWGIGAHYYIDCSNGALINANSLGEQLVANEIFNKVCKDGHVSYVPPYAPHAP